MECKIRPCWWKQDAGAGAGAGKEQTHHVLVYTIDTTPGPSIHMSPSQAFAWAAAPRRIVAT